MAIIWVKFAFCALVILFAGSRLLRYGDVIAEKSGLSKIWLGAVILAIITSLPELANNISAVTSIHSVNLAAGNVFGACLFSLLLIAVLDLFYNARGRGSILGGVEIGSIMAAVVGIILLAVAVLGIVIAHCYPVVALIVTPILSIYPGGLFSIAILLVYVVGSRIVFGFEEKRQEEYLEKKVRVLEKHEYRDVSLPSAFARFVCFALAVVIAGSWLPIISAQLALKLGVGEVFAGTFLAAVVTSLPEVAVSLAAVLIGAVDVAVAILFGSVIFNVFILFITDLFYRGGALLQVISMDHIVTAVAAIIMAGVAIGGLVYRTEKRRFSHIRWDAYTLIIIYILAVFLLYRLGTGF